MVVEWGIAGDCSFSYQFVLAFSLVNQAAFLASYYSLRVFPISGVIIQAVNRWWQSFILSMNYAPISEQSSVKILFFNVASVSVSCAISPNCIKIFFKALVSTIDLFNKSIPWSCRHTAPLEFLTGIMWGVKIGNFRWVIFGVLGVMTFLELTGYLPIASNVFVIFEEVYIISLAAVTSIIEC